MATHPPKRISSTKGLGIGTSKQMHFVSNNLAIGTEVWNEMKEPWSEGNTIIARPGYSWLTKWETGKPYILTKFLDENKELIGVYCDIARPVIRTKSGFEFDDLYLDIWLLPSGKPMLLDEDELEEAVASGYINRAEADEAYRVAQSVINNLVNNSTFLDF